MSSWRRSYHPSVLPNLVSTGSPEFAAKTDAMDSVVADLRDKLAEARLGGGEKAVATLRKAGKQTPRERCVAFRSFQLVRGIG